MHQHAVLTIFYIELIRYVLLLSKQNGELKETVRKERQKRPVNKYENNKLNVYSKKESPVKCIKCHKHYRRIKENTTIYIFIYVRFL